MQEEIEKIISYCLQIHHYLKGKAVKPPPLSQEVLRQATHIDYPSDLKTLKSEVDITKKAVEDEIRALNESSTDSDKLVTLYTFSKILYELRESLYVDEREKLKKECHRAKAVIPKLLKEGERQFHEVNKRLKFRSTLVQVLRIAVIVSACASITLLFHFPQNGTLLAYVMICVLLIIPLLTLWLNIIADDLERAREKKDPLSAEQALHFLKNFNAPENLWVLLSEPSVEWEYKREYVNMLVDLGAACTWIDTKPDHMEAIRSTMQEVLEEAYSMYPKTFDPTFLKNWKNTFEKLQNDVKEHFGKTPTIFCKKSAQDPAFFLNCFRTFLKTETRKILQAFLSEI